MHKSDKALEIITMHNEVSKELNGEKSAHHAYSLFLKAKVITLLKGMSEEGIHEALVLMDKAIEIEEELQKNK